MGLTIPLPASDPRAAPCQACQSHSGDALPSEIAKKAYVERGGWRGWCDWGPRTGWRRKLPTHEWAASWISVQAQTDLLDSTYYAPR